MKLANIIDTFISGDWGNEEPNTDTSNAVYCVRGADIVPISNSDYNNIPLRYVSDRTFQNRTLQEGDIVIEKSGGSPTQSTGRVVYISKELLEAKGNIVCSNFCTAIRIKKSWNPLYVYYYWQFIYRTGAFFNFEGKTSGIKNLQLDAALSSITIEEVSLDTQNKVVAILSSLENKMATNRAINHNLPTLDHSSRAAEVRLVA